MMVEAYEACVLCPSMALKAYLRRFRLTAYRIWRNIYYFNWIRQFYFFLRFTAMPVNGKYLVVYCSGRTGSTVLAQALASHAGIVYEEEVLRRRVWHPRTFLMGHAAKHPYAWYLVKVKPMHLNPLQMDLAQLIHALRPREYIGIHLYRHNLVNQAISLVMAKSTGVFQSAGGRPIEKVWLDPALLLKTVGNNADSLSIQMQQAEHLGFTSICYEQDIQYPDDLARTVHHIHKKLGLDPVFVPPRIKKIMPINPNEVITNWADIKDSLEKAGYHV